MFDKIKTNVSGETGEAAAGGVDYPVKPDNDSFYLCFEGAPVKPDNDGNRAEQANSNRNRRERVDNDWDVIERADNDREGEEWQQRGKRRGRFKKERREPKPPPLYISR